MALLRAQDSGARVYLPARCLIGRSRACDLVVDRKQISSQHTAIEWRGTEWEACDLGSRNGTYVDGHRLAAGERVVLRQGSELRLGRESPGWVLAEDAPPQLMALGQAGGEYRVAEGGYLVLPSSQHPEVGVYQDVRGGWIAEVDGDPGPIEDRAVIPTSDGALWRIYLPLAADGTLPESDTPLLLSQSRLRLAFTRDEEHVELTALAGERSLDLQARAHHYPLLVLARQRLDDIRAGVPGPEQGWIPQDRLLRMLNITANHLNICIHRARAQLGKLGFVDAADLVERRQGTRQLRLGVAQLELVALAEPSARPAPSAPTRPAPSAPAPPAPTLPPAVDAVTGPALRRDEIATLDIRVTRAAGPGYSVELRLGEREFPAGALDPAIAATAVEAGPDELGARLFAGLTADERVRMAWQIAAALAPCRRIRLRIAEDAPELHALPWEAMRDLSPTATARAPAADRDTPFSRLVPCPWAPAPAIADEPLRVLSAIAAPAGLDAYRLPSLDRAGEQAVLAAAMALAPADRVHHTALAGRCTLAALEAALERGAHVLHLVAHGVARRDGEVALLLEGEDGEVEPVEGSRLADMLERLTPMLRLVVLMACQSAARSADDVRAGLAPKVLAAGVPAVLVMQDRLPVATGRAFTRAFYGELWSCGEVDRAANRARAALLTDRARGSAVPVLYSALAQCRLFVPTIA